MRIDQARDERERHPDCGDEPDVLENDVGRTEAEPNVIEHNKTPACALVARTGVISSETVSAVFRYRRANSIASL